MTSKQNQEAAIVLLSGGLDSATVLALARSEGYACHCLSFDYGQKHAAELQAAAQVARLLGASQHRVASIDIGAFGGSALTDNQLAVPDASATGAGIPVTYVPARNTVFLAYALGWAEVLDASAIFIGVNSVDYSGYPDCRPEFIQAFQQLARLATKAGVEGQPVEIKAPLLLMTKGEIIKQGLELGVDYGVTLSCYRPNDAGEACAKCDSCTLRLAGFAEAGADDPVKYFEN